MNFIKMLTAKYELPRINSKGEPYYRTEWSYNLLMFLSFLFGFQFLQWSTVTALFVVGVGFYILVFDRRETKINVEFILLTIVMYIYYVVVSNYDCINSYAIVKWLIGPIGFYYLGYNIIENFDDLKKWMYMFIFGSFLFGVISLFTTIGEVGIDKFTDAQDFWTGYRMAATIFGPTFALASSLSLYFLLFNKHWYTKIIGFITLGLSVACSLIIANRTLLLLSGLMLVVTYVMYIALSKNYKKNFIITLIIIAIILLISLFIYYDVGNLKTMIIESKLYQRLVGMSENGNSILDSGRTTLWQQMLDHFFDYPFGGYKVPIGNDSSPHNLWLNMNWAAGYIPSMLLMIYSISNIINAIKYVFRKNIKIDNKIFISVITVCFFINFSLEPVLEGLPYYFILICAFNGMVAKLAKK